MRELYIKFEDAQPRIREIDEQKKYYFSQTEEIILEVKKNIKENKVPLAEKEFHMYLDGSHYLSAYVSFDNKQSLEDQIKNIVSTTEIWDEGQKNEFINKFNTFLHRERQLFLNHTFKEFAYRVEDQMKDSFFLFSMVQIQNIYDTFNQKVDGSFYSELESICKTIVRTVTEEVDYSDFDDTENRTMSEEKFTRFMKSLLANYYSLPLSRLENVKKDVVLYQKLQEYLFKGISCKNFIEANQENKYLEVGLIQRWKKLIGEGIYLDKDQKIASMVVEPMLEEYFQNEIEMQKELEVITYLEALGFKKRKNESKLYAQPKLLNRQLNDSIITKKISDSDLVELYDQIDLSHKLILILHGEHENYELQTIRDSFKRLSSIIENESMLEEWLKLDSKELHRDLEEDIMLHIQSLDKIKVKEALYYSFIEMRDFEQFYRWSLINYLVDKGNQMIKAIQIKYKEDKNEITSE